MAWSEKVSPLHKPLALKNGDGDGLEAVLKAVDNSRRSHDAKEVSVKEAAERTRDSICSKKFSMRAYREQDFSRAW